MAIEHLRKLHSRLEDLAPLITSKAHELGAVTRELSHAKEGWAKASEEAAHLAENLSVKRAHIQDLEEQISRGISATMVPNLDEQSTVTALRSENSQLQAHQVPHLEFSAPGLIFIGSDLADLEDGIK